MCVCYLNIVNGVHALCLSLSCKFKICWVHGYQFKGICQINECDTKCMVHIKMATLLFISNEICIHVNDCMILHNLMLGG